MSIKKKQVCTLILALALLTLTLAGCTSSDNGGAADGNAPSQSNQTSRIVAMSFCEPRS